MDERRTSAAERLIALLRDGEQGFRLLSEKVSHAECRAYLWEESQLRGIYADELERSLGPSGGAAHGSGTKLAALHRRWTEVKAALGASDHALLETAEICEWFAVRTYEELLGEGALPPEVESLAAAQAGSVRRSQVIVRQFRGITRNRQGATGGSDSGRA